jgi:hypothetical protein
MLACTSRPWRDCSQPPVGVSFPALRHRRLRRPDGADEPRAAESRASEVGIGAVDVEEVTGDELPVAVCGYRPR